MNLSVQLYTVREAAREDLPGTLSRLAELGLSRVEPFDLTGFGPALGQALQSSGLTAPTTHQGFVDSSESELEQLFAAASSMGIGTVIEPHVPAERWSRAADVEATAATLNAVAKVAARHGIVVGYHNHAHEISSRIGGVTALEHLTEHLEPEVVLEVDAYWVAVGGEDPLALLERLGSRVVALHVKDGPGTSDTKEQVAVGQGTQPIKALLEATPDALHVIELDDCAGDRFTAVADSVRFLQQLAAGR